MVTVLNRFRLWLEAMFMGPQGYTIYADGHMERGVIRDGSPSTVNPEGFHKLFGKGAELSQSHFFVPGSLLGDLRTNGAKPMVKLGRQFSLMGEFRALNGQPVAVAAYALGRFDFRVPTYALGQWFLYLWLFVMGMEVISGTIIVAQGELTPGDAMVIGLTLLASGLVLFLPRLITALSDWLFNEVRGPTIAKLSALVQHQA